VVVDSGFRQVLKKTLFAKDVAKSKNQGKEQIAKRIRITDAIREGEEYLKEYLRFKEDSFIHYPYK